MSSTSTSADASCVTCARGGTSIVIASPRTSVSRSTPPGTRAAFDRLGRIEIGRTTDDKVEVAIIRRGSSEREQHSFDRVIDCRGPRNEVDVHVPLHAQLVKDGKLRADALNQGLDVAAGEALIGRDGTPSDRLFVLGPPTRGRYTEIVAIPDIRLQAADVANRLIGALQAPSGLVDRPAA